LDKHNANKRQYNSAFEKLHSNKIRVINNERHDNQNFQGRTVKRRGTQ